MGAPELRNRVVLDILVERLLPPFDPPPAGLGPLGALVGCWLAGAFVLCCIASEGDSSPAPALVLSFVAGLGAVAGGVLVARHRRRKRTLYVATYTAAYERAQRLLAGTARPHWGDSEAALADDVARLHALAGRG